MSNTTLSSAQPSSTSVSNTETFFTTNPNPNPNSNEYTLTEEEIKQFKQRFNEFDQNGDGKISMNELKSMETSLGMNPTSSHIQKEFSAADIDGNGYIDFDEFCIGMQKQKQKDLKKTETEIKNTFNEFDQNGDGKIDEIELEQGFNMLGIDRTHTQFDNMMNTYDINHDELLSYPEFYKLVLNEASQTSNDNNNNISDDNKFQFGKFSMHMPDIDPMCYLYGGAVLGLCLFICIIRCICCKRKRGKVKIYNALTTREILNDERDDLIYDL